MRPWLTYACIDVTFCPSSTKSPPHFYYLFHSSKTKTEENHQQTTIYLLNHLTFLTYHISLTVCWLRTPCHYRCHCLFKCSCSNKVLKLFIEKVSSFYLISLTDVCEHLPFEYTRARQKKFLETSIVVMSQIIYLTLLSSITQLYYT